MSATAVAQPTLRRPLSPHGVIPKWGSGALYGATAVVGLGLMWFGLPLRGGEFRACRPPSPAPRPWSR